MGSISVETALIIIVIVYPRALNDVETRDFAAKLNAFLEECVEIPRIKIGERQTIETLINEETLLFAKYLRNEKKDWTPKIPTIYRALSQNKNAVGANRGALSKT